MEQRITPADFMSGTPPPRIIGSECEYDVQLGVKPDDRDIHALISPAVLRKSGYRTVGQFLDNGARVYQDCGLLEYATPESLGPREAAATDLAGIAVVATIVRNSGADHDGVFRIAGSAIKKQDKRIIGGATSGYHENYLVPRHITERKLFAGLMGAHLASRVWSMSGAANRDGYSISQKIRGIGMRNVDYRLSHRTTQGDKPLLAVPSYEHDADLQHSSLWARAEVRYADPGRSPAMRFLTFASTSLVLRLVEHRDVLRIRHLRNIELSYPAFAASVFADDLDFNTTGETTNGHHLSAINIGEMLVKQVVKLSERIELPQDELDAIPLWIATLDKMRSSKISMGEYGGLETICDFAAKHRYLVRKYGFNNLHTDAAIRDGLLWDRVDQPSTGQLWWDNIPQSFVSQDEIDHFVHEAPRTRAAVRASLIRNHPGRMNGITWGQYSMSGNKGKIADAYGNSLR